MKKLPDVLYHYCSLESAVAILENQTFRLSNILHMNDGLEFKWLQRMALERLEASNDEVYDKEVLVSHDSASHYCFCMSELADSLSQWRAYGNDGYGVALGINPSHFKLVEVANKWNLYNRHHGPVTLTPICYDKEEQHKIIDEVFKNALKFKTLESVQCDESVPSEVVVSDMAGALLSFDASRCKNPAFSEEAEWRFVYRHDYDANEFDKNFALSKLGVTVRGRTLVPFYELSFDKGDHVCLPIVRIVLGPNVNSETEETLRLFLEDRAYPVYVIDGPRVEIIKSRSSYRRL